MTIQLIEDWSNVPDGGVVSEDCYPEIYEVFTRNGKRWLRQIGWSLPKGRKRALPKEVEREIDFDPQPFMDQPWYYLTWKKPEDYGDTVDDES